MPKQDVTISKEITAYPNPAKDYVAFYFNLNDKNKVANIVVVDLAGKQVYRNSLSGSKGQHIWDTQKISNGQYVYVINTVSGEKYTGKLSIQK